MTIKDIEKLIEQYRTNHLLGLSGAVYDTELATFIHEAHRKELKLFEELTPQGSEFFDEPDRVRDYIKEQLDLGFKARKEVIKLKRELKIIELKGKLKGRIKNEN